MFSCTLWSLCIKMFRLKLLRVYQPTYIYVVVLVSKHIYTCIYIRKHMVCYGRKKERKKDRKKER